MDILLRREQSDTVGRVNFKLWSKIELDDDEMELVNRYRFDDAILIAVEQPELLRQTAFVGGGAFLLSIGFLLSAAPSVLSVGLAILIGIGAAFVFYNERRETIFAKDLIHGRDFKCDSVIELAQKRSMAR